jgi:GH24 family phage-related lysozyme (muramidase)/LysM repeat protein|tara:strand:+ start:2508 stop:4352 length:1845 start_codon:yes stop_codon:yes gene_type:complete
MEILVDHPDGSETVFDFPNSFEESKIPKAIEEAIKNTPSPKPEHPMLDSDLNSMETVLSNVGDTFRNFMITVEGFENKAQDDGVGNPTIGIGHKLTEEELKSGFIKIGDERIMFKDGLSDKQVNNLFEQDVTPFSEKAEDFIAEGKLGHVPNLQQAVTSLLFNVGRNGLDGSKALKALKRGDLETFKLEAFDAQVGFVNAGGEPILRGRRGAELALLDPNRGIERAVMGPPAPLSTTGGVADFQRAPREPAELPEASVIAEATPPRKPEAPSTVIRDAVPPRKPEAPAPGPLMAPEVQEDEEGSLFDFPNQIPNQTPGVDTANAVTLGIKGADDTSLQTLIKNNYTVASGDTLTSIADRFGTTIEQLVDLNNITDRDKLAVGQEILTSALVEATPPLAQIERPNIGDDFNPVVEKVNRARFGMSPVKDKQGGANFLKGIIPTHVRSFLSHIVGTDVNDIRDQDFFTLPEQGAIITIVGRAADRMKVKLIPSSKWRDIDYDKDYRKGQTDVSGRTSNALLGDPEAVVKWTLGDFLWRVDKRGHLLVKDKYNFNDAKSMQSRFPTFLHKMGLLGGITGAAVLGKAGLYGVVRTAGALFGSTDGSGAEFTLDLGKIR